MSFHEPVLLQETVKFLRIKPDGMYLDCTAGFGGHSSEILKHLSDRGKLIMIDRDNDAVDYLKEHFKQENTQILHMNFSDIGNEYSFDGILADLGISSYQVDNPERGFSYRYDAELDMRMDNASGNTLAGILKDMSVEEISEVIEQYGEERRAYNIACSIKKQIADDRMNSTFDLKHAVIDGCRGKGVKYALRRVFQAFRIMINEELHNLEIFLNKTPSLLNREGRVVIISYHSLEDRMIKQFLKSSNDMRIINKHVIKPHYKEIESNKRARSAKLRCAERQE